MITKTQRKKDPDKVIYMGNIYVNGNSKANSHHLIEISPPGRWTTTPQTDAEEIATLFDLYLPIDTFCHLAYEMFRLAQKK